MSGLLNCDDCHGRGEYIDDDGIMRICGCVPTAMKGLTKFVRAVSVCRDKQRLYRLQEDAVELLDALGDEGDDG
jgi:hypothetical protein